jgi:hypothetical protein
VSWNTLTDTAANTSVSAMSKGTPPQIDSSASTGSLMACYITRTKPQAVHCHTILYIFNREYHIGPAQCAQFITIAYICPCVHLLHVQAFSSPSSYWFFRWAGDIKLIPGKGSGFKRKHSEEKEKVDRGTQRNSQMFSQGLYRCSRRRKHLAIRRKSW